MLDLSSAVVNRFRSGLISLHSCGDSQTKIRSVKTVVSNKSTLFFCNSFSLNSLRNDFVINVLFFFDVTGIHVSVVLNFRDHFIKFSCISLIT